MVLVNAEDAAHIIDSIPSPTPVAENFADQLRTICLSAIAGAAAVKLIEDPETEVVPFVPHQKVERSPPPPAEILIARGPAWTLARVGEAVYEVGGEERREGIHRILIDPSGCASPVDFYSILLEVPEFTNPHTAVSVTGFLEWLLQADGLTPELAVWIAQRDETPEVSSEDMEVDAQHGRGWKARLADSLVKPLHRSIPYRTHEACCWHVAYRIGDSNPWNYSELGKALRILSGDRAHSVWLGVPMLECDFSWESRRSHGASPIGGPPE